MLTISFSAAPSHAQSSAAPAAQTSGLPTAPEPAQAPAQDITNQPQPAATGNISGTVLDTNSDVVQNASVTLDGPGLSRSVKSGSDGQFQFPNLPPGEYRLTVSAEGMRSYTSDRIHLKPGEFRIAPAISLVVSGGVSSITVSGDKEEMASSRFELPSSSESLESFRTSTVPMTGTLRP